MSRRGKQRLRRTIGETAVALAILAPPAAVGAAVGLEVATRPSEISIAPGITAEAQPTLSKDLTIAYGATVVIPGVYTDIAGLTASARINITRLDSQGHTSTEQATSAIMVDSLDSAGSVVVDAFKQRARQGLAIGASVFGLLILVGLSVRKRLETQQHEGDSEPELAPQQEALGVDPPGQNENINSKFGGIESPIPASGKRWYKIATLVAVSVVTLGGAYATSQQYVALKASITESASKIFPDDSYNPIVELVYEYAPFLKDASVSGDVGYYARESLTKVFKRMDVVDRGWKTRADYLTNTALPEFRAAGGMDWQGNPDIVAFAQVSDIHDNRPFLKHFLPAALGAMGIDFVVNTGDQMNYSGKLLLDDGADERFAQALPTSKKAIVVAGNHDEKSMHAARQLSFETRRGQSYQPLVPLDEDNDFSATVGGLVFVGSPDLNETTPAGTFPAGREDQLANNIKQGRTIADRACQIARDTGTKPIVLVHEKEATYESIVRGCTALALAGHNHKTYPVRAFANPDGSTTYQQVLGTASGDGPNNLTAIYNGPTTEGSISVWLYNLATRQLQSNISISYSANRLPSIKTNDLPASYEAESATEDLNIMSALNSQR